MKPEKRYCSQCDFSLFPGEKEICADCEQQNQVSKGVSDTGKLEKEEPCHV
jgi:hypothetical protein